MEHSTRREERLTWLGVTLMPSHSRAPYISEQLRAPEREELKARKASLTGSPLLSMRRRTAAIVARYWRRWYSSGMMNMRDSAVRSTGTYEDWAEQVLRVNWKGVQHGSCRAMETTPKPGAGANAPSFASKQKIRTQTEIVMTYILDLESPGKICVLHPLTFERC